MGKVWFYFDRNNSSEMSNAYVCHSAFNRSGDYYPASDYEALEAKLSQVSALYAKEIEARIYAERLLMNEPCTVPVHAEIEAKLAAMEKLLQAHQTRANTPTKEV